MTKEEKIKEAWREHYEFVKDNLNSSGWYGYFKCSNKEMLDTLNKFNNIETEQHKNNYWIRPKSLNGIDDNNGWIKIDSEEDLPKESDKSYFVITSNGKIKYAWFNLVDSKFYSLNNNREFHNLTHYQLIEKPEPPIY